MQDKFLKALLYTILGIVLCIFLLTQPFNVYCRVTKKCYPIALSSFLILKKGNKEITIDFKSTVKDELKDKVSFYPHKDTLTKSSNEYIVNSYIVKNLTDQEITITARYQATPSEADKYLNRIECLCFQREDLAPGEEVEMPIRFQIKDEIEKVDLNNMSIDYTIEIL